MAHKNKKPTNQRLWRVGLGNLKFGLRLKFQISYRQTRAPYNTRNKRMDNIASGNDSTYK
jgi:hypothetical protein